MAKYSRKVGEDFAMHTGNISMADPYCVDLNDSLIRAWLFNSNGLEDRFKGLPRANQRIGYQSHGKTLKIPTYVT